MMKKVYYLNAEAFTYAGLAKAILKSINLASEENMPVAIVVSTTSQFVLLDKIFPKDSFKSKCFRDSNSNITFHLHTFKTYSSANFFCVVMSVLINVKAIDSLLIVPPFYVRGILCGRPD